MAELRRRPPALGVLLCLGLVSTAHAARAQDASSGGSAASSGTQTTAGNGGSAGSGAAATGSQGTSLAGPEPGSSGPITALPSVLPATGIGAAGPDVRVGNLGNQLGVPLSGRPIEPGNGRAWTFTPSIGLSEEYATGLQQGGGRTSGGQFITSVQPGFVASGDTTRLHGELAYSPDIALYAPDGDQNNVAQNFNGRLLVTLLPSTLFLDLRGSGAVQAITAGQAPNQTNALSRGNTSQSYSFSATPYAVHRFEEWGTAEVGATYAYTAQNALQPATNQPLLASLAAASNQNVTTTSGHAAFVTGEAFARYNGTALAQFTDYDGTGVLSGAYDDTVTLDNGYAITRTITALTTIGWENIHYAGTNPVKIDDAVWNVGLRLEPNADSTITVRYGHQDGLDSVLLDAAYQPTARTRIYARYSTGLTTQTQLLQNALATSDLDALGNPVDHTTGAPLVPVGNFFGTQNSLYKTTIASLTGTLLLDRDVISASVNSQTQTLISASNLAGLALGNTSGVYGSLAWSHELRQNLQSTIYFQYGTQKSQGPLNSNQQLLAASASLSYALSPTLSGQLQYSYNQTFGGQTAAALNEFFGGGTGTNSTQSIVLVSLIKSF